MPNVYENIPIIENDNFLIRFISEDDTKDLFKVYSDKNALPFFNSDNCHGDNFYYQTEEIMSKVIAFWKEAYNSKWFVRWSIVDKSISEAIGTIELCIRKSNDDFNDMGIFRLDLRSDYEDKEKIFDILSFFIPLSHDLIGCEEIITKVPIYAVERIVAVSKCGFIKSNSFLIGAADNYAYNGYWTIKKTI